MEGAPPPAASPVWPVQPRWDATQRHAAPGWGWVVEILPHTATLLVDSGQWNPATHLCTVVGQWAVELLLHTAALPGGSGQWNSCCTLPHCLGAVGSGAPAA